MFYCAVVLVVTVEVKCGSQSQLALNSLTLLRAESMVTFLDVSRKICAYVSSDCANQKVTSESWSTGLCKCNGNLAFMVSFWLHLWSAVSKLSCGCYKKIHS